MFIISTDSGCDLPIELCKEKSIYAINMKYTIDSETFVDKMEAADTLEFYQKMRNGAVPKTSQINVGEYLDFWTELLEQKLPILHVTLGAKISGSYANALAAKDIMCEKYPDCNIIVINSTSASFAYGLLLLRVADMRENGASIEECEQWLIDNRLKVNTYYTTDELKYLCRGGRVSRTSAVFGSALNINPILHLDLEGSLKIWQKARGSKATFEKIVSAVGDVVENPESQTLYVCHCDCIDRAKKYGEALVEKYGFKDVSYTLIGPTIGSHAGPGLVAMFFLGKERTPSK
ncbi:MAG: DegV family protein [bacterium]|nr:DegV family protein [bacterium]